MKNALKITFICLVLSLMPAQAQNAAVWYFGWDNETGNLSAYTFAGSIVPLLTIEPDFPSLGWRMGDDRALALLSVNGAVGLYQLSSSGAQAVTPQLGAEGILPQVTRLAARSDPYLVLEAVNSAYSTGLLVNLTANTVEPLSGEAFAPVENWKFSADGTQLRYLSREARDSFTWNIWERTLNSGDELLIHSFDSPYPAVRVSGNGDQWLYGILDENRNYSILAVNMDGSTTTLIQTTLADNLALPSFAYSGDTLLRYTAPCSAGCQIEQLDLQGNVLALYALDRIISPAVMPLATLSPTRLLVMVENEYWLLDSIQVGQFLGVYELGLSTPQASLSRDNRWLFASDGAGMVNVWDLSAGGIVLGQASSAAQVSYSAYGAIVRDFGANQTWLYRFADAQTLTLPLVGNDFYVELLDDGTVVYVQALETNGRPAGVYRYNPADGAYILMLQNVFPLILQ